MNLGCKSLLDKIVLTAFPLNAKAAFLKVPLRVCLCICVCVWQLISGSLYTDALAPYHSNFIWQGTSLHVPPWVGFWLCVFNITYDLFPEV